uniref:ATP synthase subunit a n=1 Tax=Endeis spinosa TaxID=136194 RepID=Q535F6_9CHEL|nr:ATP synthase F0 subunit 6 [Endeis spinosa]
MMNNMFSIFDPTSSILSIKLNWLIMIMVMVVPSKKMWMPNSRYSMVIKISAYSIFSNMSAMLKNNNIMIFSWLMMMIMIINSVGLLPYVFTASTHMAFTLVIALIVWISINIFAWTKKTNLSLAHLVPMGTPAPLMPLMVLIETSSNLLRPITLSVRLMANMTAGHLLISIMSAGCETMNTIPSMMVVMMQTSLMTLEMAVAVIQAYVMMTLSALYFNELN